MSKPSGSSARRGVPHGPQMKFFTDDSHGMKVGPTTVLVMTLVYMFVVFCETPHDISDRTNTDATVVNGDLVVSSGRHWGAAPHTFKHMDHATTSRSSVEPKRSTMPHSPQRQAVAPRVAAIPQHWGNPPVPSRHRQDASCFVCAVVTFVCFVYATYGSVILLPLVYPSRSLPGVLYSVWFHIMFSLFLWAFTQTAKTDPGVVPPNWGFYMGDETKRRRYCKVCNIWKPDRTHHCSACGRCVLNMDHHCPWVNNCVGFMNRKYFIQLLIYALICLIAVIVHSGPDVLPCSDIDEPVWKCALSLISFAAVALMLLLSVTLAIPLLPFTRFHLTMLRTNSTTIENMDPGTRNRRKYDIGTLRNVQQVMGANMCLWWLPCHTATSRPVGDGVRWTQNYVRAFESEDE